MCARQFVLNQLYSLGQNGAWHAQAVAIINIELVLALRKKPHDEFSLIDVLGNKCFNLDFRKLTT